MIFMKKYILANPSGNITALVTEPCSKSEYTSVADEIMKLEPAVEQVGFVYDSGGLHCLDMAGGEFCGNASLSAAAYFLRQQAGVYENPSSANAVTLKVSGASKPLEVSISSDGKGYRGTIAMPLPKEISTFDGMPVVNFEGISHMIISSDRIPPAIAEAVIRDNCARLGVPAFGMLLWDEHKQFMRPLVYVRDADTLFWEHCCASGSCAVTSYYAYKNAVDIKMTVNQPGGSVEVDAAYDKGRITKLFMTGAVSFS